MNISGVTYAESLDKMTASKRTEEKTIADVTGKNTDEFKLSDNYIRRRETKVRNISEMLSESGNALGSAVLNSQMKQSLRILNDEEFNESDKTSADAEKWCNNEKKLGKINDSLDFYTRLMAVHSEQRLVLNRLSGFCFGNEKPQSVICQTV